MRSGGEVERSRKPCTELEIAKCRVKILIYPTYLSSGDEKKRKKAVLLQSRFQTFGCQRVDTSIASSSPFASVDCQFATFDGDFS